MKERVIDRLLNMETGTGRVKWKLVDIIFILCLFVLAFKLRCSLLPIQSADYYGFLQEWMNTIRENGKIASLSMTISNYTSPYMYIMTALSYVSTNDLYSLKLVSVFFDYVAAIAMFQILYDLTENKRKAILAMAVLLLSPTVVIDGAYWCQCDIIYTSFLLFSFHYFLKNNSRKSAIFFGLAFMFKLQAVFLLPFYLIMWLKKKTIQLRHYIWVPVIYFISEVPAWIAGRSLKELMTIYVSQSGYYPWGTLNYPNVYALLGEAMPDMHHADEVSRAGIFMTVAMLGCIAYGLYTRRVRINNRFMVTLALFTVALTVYSLPHMHDRYGFLIDLLAIIYGVYDLKKLPVTCGFMVISILAFMPYLLAVDIVPLQYLALAMLALIVYVGYDLCRQITEPVSSP